MRACRDGIAFLLAPTGDVAAWNPAADRIFGFTAFAPDERNLILDLVRGGRSRAAIPDWEHVLGNMVGVLRTHYARRSDQAVARRVDTLLAANDVFAALWREQRVEEIPMHVCTIVDPERGTLAMQLFAFTPVQSRDYTLIVLVPPFGTPAP